MIDNIDELVWLIREMINDTVELHQKANSLYVQLHGTSEQRDDQLCMVIDKLREIKRPLLEILTHAEHRDPNEPIP